MRKIVSLLAFVAIMITFAACNNGGNEPESEIVINPNSMKGMMPGRFTVDDKGTQVRFSQGNLQYNAQRGENGTWRFATHQWDTIGQANANISETYDGWIDLFGFGTGTNPTLAISGNSNYHASDEWGENIIANGGNNTGLWRTLTHDEWVYLFHGRNNAEILFGFGSVAGVNGVILLPDNWDNPMEVPGFKASTTKGLTWKGDSYKNNYSNYPHNTYSAEQWDIMEQAGAVFLPAAGYRNNSKQCNYVGTYGEYWSSTPGGDEDIAYYINYAATSLVLQNCSNKCYGRSVRLVR
jgi:hypothetical protein